MPRRDPPKRRNGHGAIIDFSSTYGNGVDPENPMNWVPVTYCAAKDAIRGLTTSLAPRRRPRDRVNAFAPGPISGNWEQELGIAPEHIEEAKAMNAMKRFDEPGEIAETVLFLASDAGNRGWTPRLYGRPTPTAKGESRCPDSVPSSAARPGGVQRSRVVSTVSSTTPRQ